VAAKQAEVLLFNGSILQVVFIGLISLHRSFSTHFFHFRYQGRRKRFFLYGSLLQVFFFCYRRCRGSEAGGSASLLWVVFLGCSYRSHLIIQVFFDTLFHRRFQSSWMGFFCMGLFCRFCFHVYRSFLTHFFYFLFLFLFSVSCRYQGCEAGGSAAQTERGRSM